MSSSSEACCTCAALLSTIPPTYDEKTEKPAQHERRLDCCGRAICARCMTDNPRFATYCPFCQVSSQPSSLPQGLRDPPAYSPPASPRPSHATLAPVEVNERPPPYSPSDYMDPPQDKPGEDHAPDVLHFVDPDKDTIASLSLAYGVPVDALRKTNNIFADHLLVGRRTILIPGKYYRGGVSLSPRPVEGEEEEARKAKVRRWMVACKVAEYDIAVLYLKQNDYNLDAAIEAFKEDERWEKEHPLHKGKNQAAPGRSKWAFGGSLAGQL
ncbi:hypothetical protein HDK77DRAFT_249901 [Phyllosticta capitalensis]